MKLIVCCVIEYFVIEANETFLFKSQRQKSTLFSRKYTSLLDENLLKTFLRSQTFRAIGGDDRFVTLVLVKRIVSSFGSSPAEWIWSDPFHWLNYEMAEQRCVQWYNKQPDPKIYTGKSQNSPFIILTRSREARQITLS